jgi:hypothetical protein
MSSQRILVIGGMLLFALSVGYGLFYDGFLAQHQHRSLLYNLDMALNMATKGDLAMASAFAAQFAAESETREAQARISLHLALAGAMTVIPLWLTPRLDVSERMKRMMALFIVAGGMVLAAGDFARVMLAPAAAGYYMVMAGYAWLGLGLAGYMLYAALSVWLNDEGKAKRG